MIVHLHGIGICILSSCTKNAYPELHYDIGFGIVSSECFARNRHFAFTCKGYVLFGSNRRKEHNGRESSFEVKCKLNDIVTLIVDLENHTIQYKINAAENGIAFQNAIQTTYKIALCMYGKHSKVEIIN